MKEKLKQFIKENLIIEKSTKEKSFLGSRLMKSAYYECESANIDDYISIVNEKAIRRRLIETSLEIEKTDMN